MAASELLCKDTAQQVYRVRRGRGDKKRIAVCNICLFLRLERDSVSVDNKHIELLERILEHIRIVVYDYDIMTLGKQLLRVLYATLPSPTITIFI